MNAFSRGSTGGLRPFGKISETDLGLTTVSAALINDIPQISEIAYIADMPWPGCKPLKKLN